MIFTGRYSSPNTQILCLGTFNHYPTSLILGIVAETAIILILLFKLIILLTIAYRVAPLSSKLSIWTSSIKSSLIFFKYSRLCLDKKSTFSGVPITICDNRCYSWPFSRVSPVTSKTDILDLNFTFQCLYFSWQRLLIGARYRQVGDGKCEYFSMASSNKTVFPDDVGALTIKLSSLYIIFGMQWTWIGLNSLKSKNPCS